MRQIHECQLKRRFIYPISFSSWCNFIAIHCRTKFVFSFASIVISIVIIYYPRAVVRVPVCVWHTIISNSVAGQFVHRINAQIIKSKKKTFVRSFDLLIIQMLFDFFCARAIRVCHHLLKMLCVDHFYILIIWSFLPMRLLLYCCHSMFNIRSYSLFTP